MSEKYMVSWKDDLNLQHLKEFDNYENAFFQYDFIKSCGKENYSNLRVFKVTENLK